MLMTEPTAWATVPMLGCTMSLSHVLLFVTSDLRLFVTWTIARQPSLSMKILQARILEWVAMPSS